MQLTRILEALIVSSPKPLSLDRLQALLEEEWPGIERDRLREALDELTALYAESALELKLVAGGYRFQIRQHYASWVGRLSEEKPQKYSRALLETLAIIAYRQPITRGDIEDIRGVAVNSQIIRTLQEREWIRVVGHKEVPGRPALLATTRQFLDYFNLHSLDQLPPLADLRDLEEIERSLDLGDQEMVAPESEEGSSELDPSQPDSSSSTLH